MSKTFKPAAAILVLLIMVLSAVGFAFNSASVTQVPQGFDIPNVIREPLTAEQQITILRNGRVLIEHYYQINCTGCLEKQAQLETFAAGLEGYVVLNEVIGNESRLGMIGWDPADASRGKIVDLENQSLDYESLIGTFCDIAIAQPRSCILREF